MSQRRTKGLLQRMKMAETAVSVGYRLVQRTVNTNAIHTRRFVSFSLHSYLGSL